MKKKSIKTLLTTALAMYTIMTSTLPAMAADVEVTGDDSAAQSQSVEVSAEVSSLYSVTLPAVIELTRQGAVATNPNDASDTGAKDGFWCNFKIGAAGKLLSSHTLTTRIQDCTMTGENTGNTFQLKAFFYKPLDGFVSDALSRFYTYGGDPLSPTWVSTEIGSCDYDGTSLTNCEYNYKSFWVGVPEDELNVADVYKGSMVVNFTLE